MHRGSFEALLKNQYTDEMLERSTIYRWSSTCIRLEDMVCLHVMNFQLTVVDMGYRRSVIAGFFSSVNGLNQTDDIIGEYVTFTKVYNEQCKIHGRTEQAVRETIRICKDKNVLKEYLESRENGVKFLCSLKSSSHFSSKN